MLATVKKNVPGSATYDEKYIATDHDGKPVEMVTSAKKKLLDNEMIKYIQLKVEEESLGNKS